MKHIRRLLPIALLLMLGGLTLYAYRDLPSRAFAADDYQWLVSVQGLPSGKLLQQAFDPLAQRHFYRPLIWTIIWLQVQLFGLNPTGFHFVSLALHLINIFLSGLLATRLVNQRALPRRAAISTSTACVLACGFMALHPAPFEAIVWISAQSELLGTCLLLLAIHAWLPHAPARSATLREAQVQHRGSKAISIWWSVIAATILLALAMLAKESAILGLPLMLLLGWRQVGQRWHYLPPLALTLAFVLLQIAVGQQNRVLREGLYGIGPQVITNPLRSLALVVAPLPGTEHADNPWLVSVGLVVALALGIVLLVELRRAQPNRPMLFSPLIMALLLTLAPTAPFRSPPDSRYLYLPVALVAVLIGTALGHMWASEYMLRWKPLIITICCLAIWWGSGELALREWRFAAGNGPGGSLWRLSGEICASVNPGQMILVDPPIAIAHVEAIVRLSCGPRTRPLVVGRAGLDNAIQADSVVIGFPGGNATVERWV